MTTHEIDSFAQTCNKFNFCNIDVDKAENLERLLIFHTLKGEVYRETPFEAMDRLRYKMLDDQILPLLSSYATWTQLPITALQIAQRFLNK